MQTAAIRMTGVDNRNGSDPSKKSGLKIEVVCPAFFVPV
jgi:hypothetical protein